MSLSPLLFSRNSKLATLFAAVIVILFNAESVRATQSHVHVLEVDNADPAGRPAVNVTIRYGFTEQVSREFGLTNQDGIAEGKIDTDWLAEIQRIDPAREQFTGVKLFIVGGQGIRGEKEIKWAGDEQLAKGFAVSIRPPDERVILGGGEFAPAMQTQGPVYETRDVEYCYSVCAPVQMQRCIPTYIYWSDGTVTCQPCVWSVPQYNSTCPAPYYCQ